MQRMRIDRGGYLIRINWIEGAPHMGPAFKKKIPTDHAIPRHILYRETKEEGRLDRLSITNPTWPTGLWFDGCWEPSVIWSQPFGNKEKLVNNSSICILHTVAPCVHTFYKFRRCSRPLVSQDWLCSGYEIPNAVRFQMFFCLDSKWPPIVISEKPVMQGFKPTTSISDISLTTLIYRGSLRRLVTTGAC